MDCSRRFFVLAATLPLGTPLRLEVRFTLTERVS
jgi:hypothetical protein